MGDSSSNFILHAKSSQFHWEGNGQLSIKTFSNGKAHYKTTKGYYAVEESRYLLLNNGPYAITIDDETEVESFCIFFKEGFSEEIYRGLNESSDQLLSDPFKETSSIGFFEKTYNQSNAISHQIQMFKQRSADNDSLWQEQQFHAIMQSILFEHMKTLKEVDSLDALRSSTRNEIYKRIITAHDYIRAYYNKQITLDNIAKAASLSTNHLLRNYAKIYNKTPYQHITELRIQKAFLLLKNFDYSMTDITFEVGLNNPVSFSKWFKQHTGTSPLQFRKKVILDKNELV
jgi:AraC family transcriptional regulator